MQLFLGDGKSLGKVEMFKSFIIGCGRIAGLSNDNSINNFTHGFAYMKNQSIRLKGCADTNINNGNAFAKKFTNADQDYFKLHIYGYSNGSISDSTEFFLADFTHADSSLDYIVTDWQYVQLPAGLYDSVSFNLSSSDVGAFGMNTPNYFCIDNVGDYPLTILNENLKGISTYPNPTSNFISFTNIENVSEFKISIIDLHGKELIRNHINPTQINLSSLKSGQYIIRIESEGSIKHEKIFKI